MAAKRSPPVSSFSPSELRRLQEVVEQASRELQHEDNSITAEREQLTREILAHRVMLRATQGELDAEKLKHDALRGMRRNSTPRPPDPQYDALILVVAVITLLLSALYFGGDYAQSALRQFSIVGEDLQSRLLRDSGEVRGAELSDSEWYKPVEG